MSTHNYSFETSSLLSTLNRIAWQFDQVIVNFNTSTDPRSQKCINYRERKLLSNVMRAARVLNGNYLPQLAVFEHDCPPEFRMIASRSFREANGLMLRGELGGQNGWQFHLGIDNTEDLTAAMMLEVYVLFANRIYPELAKNDINLVVALEELLPLYHPNTDLFIAARPYFTEAEGFSPELIELARAKAKEDLKRRRPHIKNPEYRIFEVQDRNANLATEAKAVLFGSQTPEELMREIRYQDLLSLARANTDRIYLVRWEGGPVPVGIILGGQEITWTQHGLVKDVNGEIIGYYDRVIENGGRYGDEQFLVIYMRNPK